jgi:hypothetical protein
MANLSDPSTQLKEFFKQIGRTSAQVAPVARIQAELFANMADTFEAIGRNPAALRATIEKSPPTEDEAIRDFPIQRRFLADFADLSRRLRPAVRILPTALPLINSALRVGTPVVRSSVVLNNETANVFDALDDLVQNPNTLLGLRDLNALVRSGAPLFRYIAPYQSVCNYASYFFNALGSHISEGTASGTAERVLLKSGNNFQDDGAYDNFGARPSDLPPNIDPTGVKVGPPGGEAPAYVLHGQPYTPAIDAQGNADCQNGQFGYIDGPLGKGRYPAHGPVAGDDPAFTQFNRNFAGGSHTLNLPQVPGLVGTTFNGVPSLRNVP